MMMNPNSNLNIISNNFKVSNYVFEFQAMCDVSDNAKRGSNYVSEFQALCVVSADSKMFSKNIKFQI